MQHVLMRVYIREEAMEDKEGVGLITERGVQVTLDEAERKGQDTAVTKGYIKEMLELCSRHQVTHVAFTDGSYTPGTMQEEGWQEPAVGWGIWWGAGKATGGKMSGGDNYDAELEAILQAVREVEGGDSHLLIAGDCTGALTQAEWAGRSREGECTGVDRGVTLDLIRQATRRVGSVTYCHMHSHTGNIPQGYADGAAKSHAEGGHLQEGREGCRDTTLALTLREGGQMVRKGIYKSVKDMVHGQLVAKWWAAREQAGTT